MTYDEMCNILAELYPSKMDLFKDAIDLYKTSGGINFPFTISIDESYYILNMKSTSSGAEYNSQTIRRNKFIDLTSFNKIIIHGTCTHVYQDYIPDYSVGWNSELRLLSTDGTITTIISTSTTNTLSIDMEFDISEFIGNYYIEFYGYYWQNAGTVWKFDKFELII